MTPRQREELGALRGRWSSRRAARAALALGLAATLVAGSACGAVDYLNEIGEPQLDIGRMEDDIRTSLQRDLEGRSRSTSGSVASVGTVRCRQRSDVAATCFARVTRSGGSKLRKLAVEVDPETGRYRWEIVR